MRHRLRDLIRSGVADFFNGCLRQIFIQIQDCDLAAIRQSSLLWLCLSQTRRQL